MSLAQQKQIDVLKKRVSELEKKHAILYDIVKNKIGDVIKKVVAENIEIEVDGMKTLDELKLI